MNSHFYLSILPILGSPSLYQGPFTQRHQLQRHDQRLSEGPAVAACAEFAAGHAGTRGAAAQKRCLGCPQVVAIGRMIDYSYGPLPAISTL